MARAIASAAGPQAGLRNVRHYCAVITVSGPKRTKTTAWASRAAGRVTFTARLALQQVGVNQMTVSPRRGSIVNDRRPAAIGLRV